MNTVSSCTITVRSLHHHCAITAAWVENGRLGEGAFGSVCKATRKATGEVAPSTL